MRLVPALVGLALVGATLATLGPAPVGAAPPEADLVAVGASAYVAVPPGRLADTRTSAGYERLDDHTIRVVVAGRLGVPAETAAAALNLTITDTTGDGFVTAYPAGLDRPLASNLNSPGPSRTLANSAITRLGQGGAVDIYVSDGASLIVDVTGAFVPSGRATTAGRLISTEPQRLLDSRTPDRRVGDGQTVSVDTDSVPSDARAVAVTITVTQADPGYWTAFPSGTALPATSTLNIDRPGQTRAAFAIVPIGKGGLSVHASAGGHVIVDLVGYFTGAGAPTSADGLFVPSEPRRVVDTRTDASAGTVGTPVYPSGGFEFLDGLTAGAVALNLTAVDADQVGYLRTWAARTHRPPSSSLNTAAGPEAVANFTLSKVGTNGVALESSTRTHTIADVAGVFTGTPTTGDEQPVVNLKPLGCSVGVRVVIDRDGQRGLYCAADGELLAEFPVVTAMDQPAPGLYPIFTRQLTTYAVYEGELAWLYYFMGFTYGIYEGEVVAIHAIPEFTDGTLLQPESELGTEAERGNTLGCIHLPQDIVARIWAETSLGDVIEIAT